MKLKSIRIRQMPGIDDGFTLTDISPGMNVIEGPNGIGKTSLCRAVSFSLWPGAPADARIEAAWEDGDTIRTAELAGGKRTWFDAGHPSPPPDLPPDRFAGCFTIRVDQLLHENANDSELAQQIAREMSGGYDLDSVRDRATANPVTPRNRTELRKELQSARRQAYEQEDEQRKLAAEEEGMAELEEQLRCAEASASDQYLLKAARMLAESRADFAEAEIQKELFPPGMDLLGRQDLELIKRLNKEIDQITTGVNDAERAMEAAEAIIARSKIPGNEPVSAPTLQAWRLRVDELAKIERDLDAADSRAAASAAAMQEAAQWLSGGTDPDRAPKIDSASVQSASDYIRVLAGLRAESTAIEKTLSLLRANDESGDPDNLGRAVGLLSRWLSQPDDSSSGSNTTVRAGIAGLFALAAVVGGILGVLIHPALWLFCAIGAIGVVAAWLLLRPAKQPETARRDVYQSDYGHLAVDPPNTWTRPEVEQRLDEVIQSLADARTERSKTDHRKVVEAEREQNRSAGEQSNQSRREILDATGIDLSGPNLDAARLLDALRCYQTHRADAEAARAEVGRIGSKRAALLSQINAFLRECGDDRESDSEDVASARSRLDAVDQSSRELSAAIDTNYRYAEDIARLRENAAILEVERRQFLDNRSCEDEDVFRARMERIGDWTALCTKEEACLTSIRARENELKVRPDLYHLDVSECEKRIAEAEANTTRAKEIAGRITQTRTLVAQAKRQNQLESARAGESTVLEKLQTRRQDALLAMAGQLLLEKVEAAHSRLEPDVLSRASELFATFTNGRYRLEIDRKNDGGRYRAVETETHRAKTLAELSGGTRVQLLLAARLAFADSLAATRSLPLFLDEVLKHSDYDRFEAITTAMCALVKQERQLVYLTNDPVETRRIREVFDRENVSLHRIDLALVRGLSSAWADYSIVDEARPLQIPPPDRMSVREYAETLQVPRLDPRRPAGSIHLFYLLSHDLQALHRLLRAGIASAGQWRGLAEAVRSRLGLSQEKSREIDAWLVASEAFLDAWSFGRGRPCDRRTLTDGGVSARFIDVMVEIAEEGAWDARALMERIHSRDSRLKGLQDATRTRLEENLRSEGYLTDEEPLSIDEIVARVLNATSTLILAPEQVAMRCRQLWAYCAPKPADPELSLF